MSSQNPEEIFALLEKFIGPALRVTRVVSRLSQKRLAEKLGKERKFIDDVEQGALQISFEEFENFCNASDETVIRVLQCAKFLQDQESRPEKEILKEAIKECNYQIWKEKQES